MRIDVLTLFPGLFAPFLQEGLMGKAVQNGALSSRPVALRDYGLGRYNAVDDTPYGGGAGMVIRPEPVFQAVQDWRAALAPGQKGRAILICPQGRPFDQAKAAQLAAGGQPLLLVCGRYEGFDERIRLGLADESISGGDFICMGGEVVAMAIMEAVTRLLPGVLGNPDSPVEESFSGGELEYPQYTRPPEYAGMKVPEVLLSGNHAEIARWRKQMAQERTRRHRPDLLAGPKTSRED